MKTFIAAALALTLCCLGAKKNKLIAQPSGRTAEIASFTITAGDHAISGCPVGIRLDPVSYNEDNGSLALFEISEGTEKEVTCQLEAGLTQVLWFILPGETEAGSSRSFILRYAEEDPGETVMNLETVLGKLRLSRMEQPLLDYQFRMMYPPEGINELFARSGFIHPLWSPGGEVLTRIQAPDHYHHYGIWGPWAKTHIRGREVDFWNLYRGQGTVKFAGFVSQVEGPVFCGFKALQEHIDFGARGADQVALNELLDVRAWNLGEGNVWLIDYTTVLNSPLDSGILFDAYRYGGGIGFRATERWTKDNSSVLTSENKDRLSADGTKARWCLVEGESDTGPGRSGILFMGHPANREFPEPMRIWPVDSNRGRGDLYFEFVPIRHNDWAIRKGRDYALRYRMLVFDGEVSADEAEKYWQGFAHPPHVEIQSSKNP